MKREWKAALGIGGIVLLAAAAGLAAFVLVGSQAGVGFIVVGIPALLVVGVGLYVRNVVSRPGGSRSEYGRRLARQAGEAASEFLGTLQDLSAAYPEWDHADIDDAVADVVADLEAQGVVVDRAAASYTLESAGGADVQELERLQGRIEDLTERLQSSFAGHVRSEIDRLEGHLDRLEDAGLAAPEAWQGPPPHGSDPESARSALDLHREEAVETVRRAADTVEDLLAGADDDVDRERVRDYLGKARMDASNGAVESAVEGVLEARRSIEADMEGEFRDRREAVEGLLDTVQSSVAAEYVSREKTDRVADIEAAVADLESGLDMPELRAKSEQLRAVCVEMVEELAADLAEDLAALESEEVPPDFYERPAAADREYAADLRASASLEAFRRAWIEAVGDLTAGLDAVSTQAAVARSYPEMEADIEAALRRSGRVGPEDLPVREPAPFLELYAARNPGAEYDPSGPALATREGGETHTVTVRARFESGGDERAATVTIEGPTHEDSAEVHTHLAEEVTFEGVPYGEYELRADPEAGDASAATRTVTVETDLTVDLEMAEVGLREQVCEGVEDAVAGVLPELSGRLADRFDEEGYLSSAMEFPVADEYVPCLLATWADEQGLSATRADGAVLVYDGEQLAREIRTVAEYNVAPGEELAFEDLRARFLTAPLPDEALGAAIRASGAADAVELTDSGITKEDS